MPLTPEHKEKSREKILSAASKLFAAQGFENTSIDEIMLEAEMTRGGFYAHFSSKSDLYKETIFSMSQNSRLAKAINSLNDTENNKVDIKNGAGSKALTDDCFLELIDLYLSFGHVNLDANQCPLAFLATDVAVREPSIRSAYTKVFGNMAQIITKKLDTNYKERQLDGMAITGMLVGSVAVARAINNPEMAKELLTSCKQLIFKLLGEHNFTRPETQER